MTRRKLATILLVIVCTGLVPMLIRAKRIIFGPRDVYTECRMCGMSDEFINEQIATMKAAPFDRDHLLRAFHKTFAVASDVEECRPCAEKILDAAGKL